MIIEAILRRYEAEPFVPFVIHMADGRNVRVAHREIFASKPSGRTVTIYKPDGSWNIIDLLLVTDLELDPPRNSEAPKG